MFHGGMYFQVRRACLVEGMSVRETSRVFGLHRDTVRKMLTNTTPPGYTRKRPPPTRSLTPHPSSDHRRNSALVGSGLSGFAIISGTVDSK